MSNTIETDRVNHALSKRNYLGTAGTIAGAFTIIPRQVMAGKGYLQPSDTVNVAGIGIGNRGGIVIRSICTPDVPYPNQRRY